MRLLADTLISSTAGCCSRAGSKKPPSPGRISSVKVTSIGSVSDAPDAAHSFGIHVPVSLPTSTVSRQEVPSSIALSAVARVRPRGVAAIGAAWRAKALAWQRRLQQSGVRKLVRALLRMFGVGRPRSLAQARGWELAKESWVVLLDGVRGDIPERKPQRAVGFPASPRTGRFTSTPHLRACAPPGRTLRACTGLPPSRVRREPSLGGLVGPLCAHRGPDPPHASSFALCHTELRGAGCAVDQPWPAAPPPNASRRSSRTSPRTPHPPAAQARSAMISSTGSLRSWGRCARSAAVAAPHPYHFAPSSPPPAPHTARVLPRRKTRRTREASSS